MGELTCAAQITGPEMKPRPYESRDGTGTGDRSIYCKIYKTSNESQEYLTENIYMQILFQVPYIIYHYLETKVVLEQISDRYRSLKIQTSSIFV